MIIGSDIVKQLMHPQITEKEGYCQVSLFVVGKHATHIKKVNFTTVTNEKLQKWKLDKRFVTVIETSDSVYAHTHQKFTTLLQECPDLTINGKKVAVDALSEPEYERLDEIFDLFIQNGLDDAAREKKLDEKKAQAQKERVKRQLQSYFRNYHLNDDLLMNLLISSMKNIPSQIALRCLQKMTESFRELEERLNQEEKSKNILDQEIKKTSLKHEILKQEVMKEEIQKQAKRLSNQVSKGA